MRVDPFLSKGPVAPLIAAELRGRTELPRGEAIRIARKLDCSRERVRQIMNKLGVRVAPPRVALIDCASCGNRIAPNKSELCTDCRHERAIVELICTSCGRAFKRSCKEYNAFLRRVSRGGRQLGPWCSRTCGYPKRTRRICSWCGAELGHRPPSTSQGYHAFCGGSKRCDLRAANFVQPMYWPLLEPELLPMRDKLVRIRAFLARDRVTRANQGRKSQRAVRPGARGTSRASR